MNFPDLIQTISIFAIPAIFAITLHEAAHGIAAYRLGDNTAWMMGRVSLNPMSHIDLMGTIVSLAHPDGRTRRFCILGEWDRDEALGIISCKSRVALCLEGHKTGETVTIPGEAGDEAVTITAVEPLDATLREWVGNRPANG